jgi:tetratricopeptide (TPR) repeat protein
MRQTLRIMTVVLAIVPLDAAMVSAQESPRNSNDAAWAVPRLVDDPPAGTAAALLRPTDAPGPTPSSPSPSVQPLPPIRGDRPQSAPVQQTSANGNRPADGVQLLPPPPATTRVDARSDQMEQVARQADRQTRHGFELAERGAYFAARAEFLGALKLLADGLDTDGRTDAHGRALAAALTALREAEDFLPRGSRLESETDIAAIAAAHETPVLKNEKDKVTAIVAVRRYMTYAQERFATAADREVAGSIALHALGKLHNSMAKHKVSLVMAAESKAVVFYQASMIAYPQNYMAANDLGVLLAQCGEPDQARSVLEHSLRLSQQSATWHNLAVVYRQLNMAGQANMAESRATAAQQAELARRKQIFGTASDNVQWVDAKAFAQTSTSADSRGAVAPASQGADSGRVQGDAAKKTARPSTAERANWGTTQR